MKRDLLAKLLDLRTRKVPVVVMTDLATGEQRLLTQDGDVPDDLRPHFVAALREDRSQPVEHEDGRQLFFHPFNPPLKLYLVGAVHIAQPMVPMAQALGYEVTVVDPRQAFARQERFEGIAVNSEWPDEALEALGIDARTAVVTLTHDPKLDDPALTAALNSEAFYIGSLGSGRTHAARLRRLKDEGFSEEALNRIHGPVGLAIGARSPAEIAVSIMAQITEVLRKP